MAVTKHTFPQSGDSDYAENFNSMIGRSNAADYVETGLKFQNIDYVNLTFDVTEGKAFILTASESFTNSNNNTETRLHTAFDVQMPTTTGLALTDAATNYVYLTPNVGTNDSAAFNVYTDQTNAGGTDLLLGTIDTSADTSELRNRNPDVEFDHVRSFIDLGIPVYDDVTTAETGQGNIVFATGAGPSTQGLWVYDGSEWDYSGIQSLRDGDVSGVTGLIEDTSANRPAAGTEGRLFFESDTQAIFYDNGTSWVRLALDASQITASDLGFDPATQSELNSHSNTAGAHHTKTTTLDELADSDVTDLLIDTEANRPAAGTSGRVFIARDTGKVQHDNGTSWVDVGLSDHSQLSGITSSDHHIRYSDEEAQDATNALLAGGANVSLTYDDTNNNLTIDTSALDSEQVEDQVNSLLAGGNAVGLTYDDTNNSLTIDVTEGGISHDNLAGVSASDHHIRPSAGTNLGEDTNNNFNVQQGSGSGLDADLLDGVQLANINWADVALAQSDVAFSDLGAVDTNLDVSGYDLANAGMVEAQFGALVHGNNPGDVIAETTSPTSFNFSGASDRDLHERTDVTLTNGGTTSTTETVTVELYDGSDTTGTLLASENRDITVSAGATTTASFITGDIKLDTGTYHIEASTSGTQIAIDQTDEYTKGGRFTIDHTQGGDFHFQNQDNDDLITVDSVSDRLTLPNSTLDLNGNNLDGATNASVDGISTSESSFQTSAEASSGAVGASWVYTAGVEAYTEKGGSSTLIELGQDGNTTIADEIALITQGNVNLLVDANNNVQVPTGDLLDGAGNVVYDQSAGYVPQARIQQGSGSGLDADTLDALDSTQFLRSDANDSWKSGSFTFEGPDDGSGTVTITPGSDTSSSGTPSMALDVNGADITDGTTVVWDTSAGHIPETSVQQGTGSGLDADLLDGVQLANINWADVAMAQSDVNVSDLGNADATLNMNGYAVNNVNGLELDGTVDTNGNALDLDNGDQGIYIHDGTGNFNLKSGVSNASDTITAGSGGSEIELAENGNIVLKTDTSTASGSTFSANAKLALTDSVAVTVGNFYLENGHGYARQDWFLDPTSSGLADGGTINSGAATLRGYYDSDGTTTVSAASVDADLQHVANSDGSSVLDVRVQASDILRAHSTGTVALPNGDLIDGASNVVYDQSAGHVPEAQLDLANVTWGDTAMAQSDVHLSDVGAADTALNMNGYRVDSVADIQFTSGSTPSLETGGGGSATINVYDSYNATTLMTWQEGGPITAYATFDINGVDFVDNSTTTPKTIWDASNQYIPQSNVQQGSGSGLDADTLDGVQLGNIGWADTAMAQSDVNVSDLGSADAALGMGNYKVTHNDMAVRKDGTADDLRWSDETNAADRMALDRTTGDLSIEGWFTEGAAL